MAKVLLINPGKWGRGITAIWIPAHTASLRSHNHEVQLFDANFYRNWMVNEVEYNTANQQYRPTDYASFITYNDADVKEDLQRVVDEFQPDFIFWSALSSHIHGEGEYVNIQYGHELVKELKTSAVKVAGGLQVTADPERAISRFPAVDYFIAGESDLVLPDLIANHATPEKVRGLIWSDGETIRQNPRQDILHDMDKIGHYDYSIFSEQTFFRPYAGSVVKAVDYEMSRGCIYTCGYCVETVIQRYYGFDEKSPATGALKNASAYLRHKSAERIFAELKDLHDHCGVRLVRCQDTNFLTIHRPTLKRLAELLESHPLDIKLYIETRADGISAKEIELLKSLNVDGAGMGIELSSENFRQEFLNRFASQDKIIRAFDLLKEAGIKRTAYNIIGLPNEDENGILETIRFNQRLNPDNITVAFYSPYIGTEQEGAAKELEYFDDYESDVDGQLRTKSKHPLISASLLEFYKENFVRLVRGNLDDLNSLKREKGIAA